MAGSTTKELPCQATEDAKKMAILLAGPSGEEPRRAAGGKQRAVRGNPRGNERQQGHPSSTAMTSASRRMITRSDVLDETSEVRGARTQQRPRVVRPADLLMDSLRRS
jgi:hypothetical protein